MSALPNDPTVSGISGTVTINGGTVTAQGGSQSAGIGGGNMGSGAVNINGGTVIATGGWDGAGIGGGMGGAGGTITISGGAVTATGGNGGAGIGGGAGSAGGTAAITGGTVIAQGGNNAAGIGSGINPFSGDTIFSTTDSEGEKGNAVIYATGGSSAAAITDSDTTGWNGIIFQGDSGQVYGDVTLEDDLTIPDDATLTVPDGSTLTIPEGVTVTGDITNNGTINNSGTLPDDVGGTVNVPSTVSVSASPSPVTYGGSVTLTANVTNATDGTVTFYRGDAANGTVLNSASADVTNGTATYTINNIDWSPSNSPYTITAVYSGGTGLLSGSGQGSLTVSEAPQATAPSAPTQSGTATADTITLTEQNGGQNGVEYACVQGGGSGVTAPTDDGDWQTGTVFNGLQAGTAYTFFARYAGNTFYDPSPASSGTIIYTAYAVPEDGVGYTINYVDETATAANDYEVRLTESNDWTAGPIAITPGGSFQVRHAATTGGAPASDAATVNVSARPGAPDLEIDTEVEGVTVPTGYYYNTTSADYSGQWAQGDSTLVHVEPEGAIYIYAAAVASGDTPAFKSAVQTLVAPARGTTPTLPTINYETEALSGTDTGMEYGIAMGQSVPSEWTSCSANMTLEGIGWTGGEMTVYFRTAATAGTGGKYASDPVFLTIPARPAAPAAPSATDRTDTTITITALDGVEYRLGTDGTWQTGTGSIIFDDLSAGTAYTIYARYPAVTGDNPAFASAESTLQVTTKASAGEAPDVGEAAVTDITVTLPYDAAWEYRAEDSADWNSGTGANVFTGLTAATEYTFYVRVKETDDAEASNEATVTVYTAHAAPTPASYTIDFAEETIAFDDGYEANTAEGFSGTTITNGASLESYMGGTLYIRHEGDVNGAPASVPVAISIPARPETPTQAIDNATESIAVAAGQEYKLGDAADWTRVETDAAVTVAPETQIQIRVAAVAGTSFASEILTRTAPRRGAIPNVSIGFAEETLTGASTAIQYRVGTEGAWKDYAGDTTLGSFGWDGSADVTVYFRTAATNESYASGETSGLTVPARPGAPDAPAVTVRTDTSITIAVAEGVQYKLDDGSWETFANENSHTYSGLEAGSAHIVYARYPAVTEGVDSAFASGESSTEVSTKASAPNAPTVSGTYGVSASDATKFAYTITAIEGAEYRMGDGEWQGSYVFDGIEPESTVTFYARFKETDDTMPGELGSVQVTFNRLEGSGSVSIEDWTYGELASEPVAESSTNGTDGVTYEYKERDADDSAYTTTRPTDAGLYTVRAIFAATATYQKVAAAADFEIHKAATTLGLTASPETLSGGGRVTLSLAGVPGDGDVTVSCDDPAVRVVDAGDGT